MEVAPIKTLVVYDSQYGNTEIVARAVGEAIGAEVRRPIFGGVTVAELSSYDLLIVGSPTQEGRQLDSVRILIDVIPDGGLKDRKVAAFDTRHKWKFLKVFNYAAPRIAEDLRAKGGSLITEPEGFYVRGTKGPLLDGELERAVAWAKSLVKKL